MLIRAYKQSDYSILEKWYKHYNLPCPTINMLPVDSSFILEKNNKPIISVCVYLTNAKEVCYVENLIADPDYRENDRNELIQELFTTVKDFARSLGYKRLMCLAYEDKLKKRYLELGWTKTLDNVSTFIREL